MSTEALLHFSNFILDIILVGTLTYSKNVIFIISIRFLPRDNQQNHLESKIEVLNCSLLLCLSQLKEYHDAQLSMYIRLSLTAPRLNISFGTSAIPPNALELK